MQIGLTVEHNDEKYKIINHEKPYANFARHVQYNAQLCLGNKRRD